jgi:hypothetical protein
LWTQWPGKILFISSCPKSESVPQNGRTNRKTTEQSNPNLPSPLQASPPWCRAGLDGPQPRWIMIEVQFFSSFIKIRYLIISPWTSCPGLKAVLKAFFYF